MFLGSTAEVTREMPLTFRQDPMSPLSFQVVHSSASEFSLQLIDNPLAEFVELPEQHSQLAYSCILCGVLRGRLQFSHDSAR